MKIAVVCVGRYHLAQGISNLLLLPCVMHYGNRHNYSYSTEIIDFFKEPLILLSNIFRQHLSHNLYIAVTIAAVRWDYIDPIMRHYSAVL